MEQTDLAMFYIAGWETQLQPLTPPDLAPDNISVNMIHVHVTNSKGEEQ